MVGQKASLSKTFTEDDVIEFARLSGDTNPIHIDDKVASKSIFGKRIVHGMLTAGLISAVLGTKFPGEGTIYLKQTINFLRPVYIGDTVTAICELLEIRNETKGIYRLSTICVDQNDQTVIEGEVLVKYT